MKASTAKSAKTPQTPVFPEMLHHVRIRARKSTTNPKPERRDNVFLKSRDTREDRGTRQIKIPKRAPHVR
jgi:hypothetical protein